MSESEKELQKAIDDGVASGQDTSRLREDLRQEEKRVRHSRNR